MDAMRSVLMLLGVVLHAAQPYAAGHHWLVADSHQAPIFAAVVTTIQVFRMPAFFVVAGYFSMMVLRDRSTALFLGDRLRRMLVPMVTVFISLNLLQMWMLADPAPRGLEDFFTHEFLSDLWSGKAVGHLWFLINLAVYVSIVALLARPLRRFARSGWADTLRSPIAVRAILALLALTPIAILAGNHLSGGLLEQTTGGVIDGYDFFAFMPFFAFGMLLECSDAMLATFSRPPLADTMLGIACGVIYAATRLHGVHGSLENAVSLLAMTASSWICARYIFWGFRRFASRASSTWRYLSDASYSVYLFHHIVVIALALWLLPYDLGAGWKYLIVLTGASTVSIAAHHFIVRRFALTQYLFNGRKQRRRHAVEINAEPA